jgi:hypothetical protein
MGKGAGIIPVGSDGLSIWILVICAIVYGENQTDTDL